MKYYLDNAATTKINESVLKAYNDSATTFYGNPSANYPLAHEAKNKLEETRINIANILDVDKRFIYFTSGGSESNAIILSSLIWNKSPGEIIISNIEHASAFEFTKILKEKGWTIKKLDAPRGFVSAKSLEKQMNERTRMVCIMTVNNVIGSIQNIEELVKVVRKKEQEYNRKIHFHTDSVQALGKIPFDLNKFDVDSASFSAHKLHGPRGIGILYNRQVQLLPLSKAGGQENGLRGGTENLPAIVAMEVALKEQISTINEKPFSYDKVLELNKYIRDHIHPTLLSPSKNCSPYIISFSVSPLPSEVFSRMLSDKGIFVSSGSACSNNAKTNGEKIIKAMKFDNDVAKGSIRLSLCDKTTMEEIIIVVNEINNLFDTFAR